MVKTQRLGGGQPQLVPFVVAEPDPGVRPKIWSAKFSLQTKKCRLCAGFRQK